MPPTNRPEPRRVFLVGMMGSGKSTVGRALERRLGWPYVDNDVLLEEATGSTARELLAAGGTPAVRKGEAMALRAGLDTPPPAIVGVAAGTVLDPEARAALDGHGTIVWLRGQPGTLVRRVLAVDRNPVGSHRPWHGGRASIDEWFVAEDERRTLLYGSIADITVDVDTPDGRDRTTDEITADIVRALADEAPVRTATPDPGGREYDAHS